MSDVTIHSDQTIIVRVQCPHCREHADLAVALYSRLTAIKGEAKLGVKVAQKPLDHRCGQTSLTIVSETGEVLTLGMDD